MTILDRAKALQPELVSIRRGLHREPEPSYREEKTAAYLAGLMRDLGYSVRERQGGMGLIADLEKRPGGETVLLRADMDSLPIEERSGEAFSSDIPGQAHLCGHDAHCAMAIGAAKLLADSEADFDKNVRIVFQSAEEIPPGGAIEIIGQGALEGVCAAYALHVDPRIPTGSFGSRPGPMMASVNEFRITIQGKGGHAAYPHLAADPIVVGARLVTALQTLVSRRLPPDEPGVVSVCQFESGTTFNVIPDQAYLCGTTRFYRKERVAEAKAWIEEVAEGVCAGSGCRAEVDFKEGYPPLVNDSEAISEVQRTVGTLWGEEAYREVDLQGAGEDFARYLENLPGAMVFIGIGNEELGSTHFLHSPHFKLDEDCLWRGAALLAAMAGMRG